MGKVTKMKQRQFGLKPKNSTITYRKPYPSWYDQVVLPPRYRIPNFVKFTRTRSTSTMEHISQYLAQLGELSDEPAFRVLFSLCLYLVLPSHGLHLYHMILLWDGKIWNQNSINTSIQEL
jgi:hypothetical protein